MIIKRGILEILNLDFLPDGLEKKEIMVEHSVSIKFELSDYVKLEKGDFIIHDEKHFSLNKDFIPVINKSTNGFIYDLKFYDITERFKDFKLKFQLGTVDELDFKLTTSGDKFLDIVIYSLHKHGLGTFTKGQFPSEIKEIHFKNVDIFSGLNQIANEYGLEWWIDGTILNLGKLEYGEPVLLRNDIELEDISFSPSSEKLITRLYAFGSSRNIPSNYRINEAVGDIAERRLRLPIGTEYVDLFHDLPENQVVEGVHVFEDIYPRQKNTIIDVLTIDVSGTVIYTFKGDNTFTITHDDIIAGKPLKIAFQSGLLAGKDFDLIISDNNYFEIRYEQSGDVYLPNMTLKPQVGDEFFFFNFKADNVLPVLITQAENELLTQAQSFLDKIGSEYVYTTKNRSIHCEENGIDLDVGQVVTLLSETIGSVTSRIRGYEKKLYNKFECDYSIGSYSKYSRIDKIEKETGSKADKTEISEIGGKVENVSRYIQNMDLKFLSKISEDTAKEVITFLKGIIAAGTSEFVNLIASGKITAENIDVNNALLTDILCVVTKATLQDVILEGQINSETFTSGFLGEGFRLKKDNDRWVLEIDDLVVRKTMQIYELIVQRVRYQGGQVLHSPAGGKITAVTDGGTYWRCEHDSPDDFITGDQVLCDTSRVGSMAQNPEGETTFMGVRKKRYWRKVTSYGAGWFNLSKTDMEAGSDYPEVGDNVGVVGNDTDVTRQSAYMIVSVGNNSPYTAHYAGINSYTLSGKEVVREGNLSGVVDSVFGQLSGYGLYSKNVFLRGIFKLVNGTDVGQKLAEHDTTFLSTASKTEVSTAKSEAISTAASDATIKANTAQINATNAAKGYTDGQVSPLVTRITSAETAIAQNADAISLRATKTEAQTYATDAVDNLQIGVRNLILKGGAYREIPANQANWRWYTLSEPLKPNVTYRFIAETLQLPTSADKGIKLLNKVGGNNNNFRGLVTLGSYFTTPYNDVVAVAFTKNAVTDTKPLIAQNVAIYEGSKCPDRFVEAPEDVQAYTDLVRTDLSAELTVQAGLIASKVSQSDFNALGVRVSTAEQKITPSAITQTVRSSTEYGLDRSTDLASADAAAANRIKNIVAGGGNLLLNSARSFGSQGSYGVANTTQLLPFLKAGNSLTFSCTVNIENPTSASQWRIGFEMICFQSDGSIRYLGAWKQITSGVSIKNERISNTYILSQDITSISDIVVYPVFATGTNRWVKDLKVELGNVPTAWDNDIDKLKSNETAITQTANKLSLTASSIASGLGGKVNQSTGEVTITPSNISLKVFSSPEYGTEKTGILGTAASDATNKANSIRNILSTITEGKMLYKDPTFKKGYNGINIYNNSGGSGSTFERVGRSTDAPNGSTHMMRYSYISSPTSPGFGGFYFGNMSRANAVFVTKIIAKIPVGKTINWASNAYGTDGNLHRWLTSQAGTGKFETYIIQVRCGSQGTFSSTNFFYFTGGSGVFNVDVAFATVFDTTLYDNTEEIAKAYADSGIGTAVAGLRSDLAGTGIDIQAKRLTLYSGAEGGSAQGKIVIAGSNFSVNEYGKLKAVDGEFSGEINALTGRIGSLRINGSALTNAGFDDDAYIILRNDPHGTFVGIGGNVLPASSGLKAVGRFENKSVDGFFGSVNYSLLVEASGASRNVGIYCIGDLLLKGGALIAEKCYTDAGYTNSITLNIDKFSKYLFNPPMGSINTVYMPSGTQVLNAVGSVGLTGSNWCFDIGVSIHYSSSGGINLRGVSGGIIVNNNGDVVGHNDSYTYGGIQMKKGDHVTLRYYSVTNRWLIIDHQY